MWVVTSGTAVGIQHETYRSSPFSEDVLFWYDSSLYVCNVLGRVLAEVLPHTRSSHLFPCLYEVLNIAIHIKEHKAY